MIRHRFKLGLALIVPLFLYAVLAERASWRPRILRYSNAADAVIYSPDGRWLACASTTIIELHDAHTEQVVWKKNLGGDEIGLDTINAIAFAPDSQTLALSRYDTRGNNLQLWDVPTHMLRYDLLSHYPYWHSAQILHFTPNSTRLITGGDDSEALLWDTHTGKRIHTIVSEPVDSHLVLAAADDQTLAFFTYVSDDDYVKLWDMSKGKRNMLCTHRLVTVPIVSPSRPIIKPWRWAPKMGKFYFGTLLPGIKYANLPRTGLMSFI